jgi:multiple sugar transport system substrate-binding protein
LLGAAGASALAGTGAVAQPAVRRKVKLTYWNWADNPSHQRISLDSVDMFNKSQNFIEVEVDATMAVMESRKKLVVAFAAGGAPDVIMTVQYWVQDLFRERHPASDRGLVQQMGREVGFLRQCGRAGALQAGQPVLYLPQTSIPYYLFYRADWLKEAGVAPPDTYDQFVAAAKAITKAPDRYGFAMRGQTYSAIQVILPIWASAGVQFADQKGNVDFDSKAAIEITEKWVGMYTKDKSAQPTAVNDGYREQYALMEKSRCGFWFYWPACEPGADDGARRRDPGPAQPARRPKRYMLANPEGPMMTTSCKEKEAAWEFMRFIGSGDAVMLYTANRAVPPVRKSVSQHPTFQNNRFIKLGLAESDTWWTPPYEFKNWTNFQDKIAPFWQETLREKITVTQFHQQAAKFPARAGIAFRISGSDPKVMAGHAVDLRSALCGEEFDRRVVELRRQDQLLPADLVRRVVVGLVIQRQLARPRLG